MDHAAFDRLNSEERACLRLHFGHFTSKQIGQQLGRSPHTIDGYFRSVLRKTGYASRGDAARAFAEHERLHQRLSTQSLSEDAPLDLAHRSGIERRGVALKEVRAPFEFEDVSQGRPIRSRDDDLIWTRLTAVFALVLLIALIIISVFPMADAFQRLALRIHAMPNR